MSRLLVSVGIDPGMQGGICILSSEQNPRVMPMPLLGGEIDVKGVQRLLLDLGGMEFHPPQVVVSIEKAQAMPGQGVTSMFSYGKGFGALCAVVQCVGLRLELVTPQSWKKHVLAGTPKDKDAAVDYVTRAFPAVSLLASARSRKPHDGIADAVCIAEFGWRVYLGQVPRAGAGS